MNSVMVVTGILCMLLLVTLSSGCINMLLSKDPSLEQTGDAGSSSLMTNPVESSVSQGLVTSTPSSVVSRTAVPAVVDEVSPHPYVTPDPYRLPYRDHGNWTTGEPVRVLKNPEFSKKYVLRSNSTAVRVNVSQAPLVIDLTFNPQWTSPDHTGIGGGVAEDGSVSTGTSVNSFVYSKAVVTVHHEGSSAVVEQDGFGDGFSTALEKKITIYREGTYVILLTGDFMDISMAITTGAGAEKPLASPVSAGSIPDPEEEGWG